MGGVRFRYGRHCPWCCYRFVLEVRPLVGQYPVCEEVVPVLLDFRGREEVAECPGCGRESTPWNTLAESRLNLNKSLAGWVAGGR